jgi:hypothetical protein
MSLLKGLVSLFLGEDGVADLMFGREVEKNVLTNGYIPSSMVGGDISRRWILAGDNPQSRIERATKQSHVTRMACCLFLPLLTVHWICKQVDDTELP